MLAYQPCELPAYVSSFMHLENGDVIMSGTPEGVNEITAAVHFADSIMDDGSILTLLEVLVG